MAKNKKHSKLGRTTKQRTAMLKTQVTDLLVNGTITTTVARAKATQAIANKLIALGIKEKDNFEEVEVKVVRAKRDASGKKVTELAKSKNGKEYLKVVKEETTEKRQKDLPSRLHTRRLIMCQIAKIKDEDGKNIDVPAKLFGELADKYTKAGNVGGYTKLVKVGPRKGDGAELAILKLI